jgi:hypothetical protein
MKPRRKKRRSLAWAKKIMGTAKPVTVCRLFNIEKLARDLGVAKTDDFDRFLTTWIQCNPHYDIEILMRAAVRMGGSLSRKQAEAIMDEAEASRPHTTAEEVGRYLGVTDEIRQRLGLWTIRPTDVSEEGLMARCKCKGREREQRRRRQRGARPREEYEANSLSKTKPWEALGISRRTWYRQQASVANDSQVGTGPCALPLGNIERDTLVPASGASKPYETPLGNRASPHLSHSIAGERGPQSSARTRHRASLAARQRRVLQDRRNPSPLKKGSDLTAAWMRLRGDLCQLRQRRGLGRRQLARRNAARQPLASLAASVGNYPVNEVIHD